MLNRLFPRRAPAPKPLPQPDSQLALGALLVRVALADRAYRQPEVAAIDRILAETFNLKPLAAAKLRATCTDLEMHAADKTEFTRILRNEVAYEERLALARAMWQVALSDGQRHDLEEASLHEVEAELGISQADSDAIQQSALGGTGS